MMTDIEIIGRLERELGCELLKRGVAETLPWASRPAEQGEPGEVQPPREFKYGRDCPFASMTHEPAIGCFLDDDAHVVGLALHGLKLRQLPSIVTALRHLKKLNLAENLLKTLPPRFGELQSLEALCLYNNPMTRLPRCVFQLRKLKDLLLNRTRLTSLPDELAMLEELEELYAHSMRLHHVPECLSKFTHLRMVNLGENRITTIPEWVFNLGFSVHVDNQSRDKQRRLILGGNPLESPPAEIIEQGRDAVLEYFASLEPGSLRLNEVKVLLVGDGGAGKTCLVKRLLAKGYNPHEEQTDGINIDHWVTKVRDEDVTVHLWDFGGQEIMHATHQFFLSERSVYVLVLDGRKEEDAEYWLKHIESFGGQSPVLVVLNKMDENPGFDVNRRFLQQKYKGVVGFYPISCRKNKGIDAFSAGLVDAIDCVEIIGTRWPSTWFRIKTRLEQMADHFIGYDAYQRFCEKENITDETSQDTLVKFLHDLGVIVHFSDFHLRDMHVLEPRWLTGGVYRIINSDILADKRGILKLRSLRTILKTGDGDDYVYPTERHPYIIDLMKKFELCYSIDEKTILIPDLLEVQEPEINFDYGDALRFRIDYDFLPKSVIPRFIVRRNQSIVGNLRWRTGVVLEDDAFQAEAVIRADETARRIYVYVTGEQRRDYLTVIRSTFLDINRGFEKLDYAEKVPLPDKPDVAVSYDHLLLLAKEGREECYPDGAEHPYRVSELLGILQVERQRTEEEFMRILKGIVSESDSEKSLMRKAEDVIVFQPNFMGMGIDFKALVSSFWRRRPKP